MHVLSFFTSERSATTELSWGRSGWDSQWRLLRTSSKATHTFESVLLTVFGSVVELVRKFEHEIIVYRIRLCITARKGIYHSADVALLLQYIVHLKR